MADNYASNYNGGRNAGGDAPIVYLGQTEGPYGNDPDIQTPVDQVAKPLKP